MNIRQSPQDIDNWLNTIKTSFRITSDRWNGSDIANDVFDKEATLRFDSHEERLLFRIETWLDLCQGEGTFKNSRRTSKRKNRLAKTRNLVKRTNSMKSPEELRKMQSSISFDSLQSSENEDKYNSMMQGINYSKKKSKTLNSSYSTTDLSTRLHETVISDIVMTSSSSESSIDDVIKMTSQPPKQSLFGSLRMRLFSFGRTLQTPSENTNKSQPDLDKSKFKRRSKTAPVRKHKKRKSTQDEKYVTDLDKDEGMDGTFGHVNFGHSSSSDAIENSVCPDTGNRYSDLWMDIDEVEHNKSKDADTLTKQPYDDGDELTLKRIPKSRPSLFGMKDLVQSTSVDCTLSPEELLDQEPLSKSLDHIDMKALRRKEKFKTFSGVRKDVFSRGELNDSIRRYHTQKGKNPPAVRLSLDVTKNEADLGFI